MANNNITMKSNMLSNFKAEPGPKSWENMRKYDPKGYVPSFDWAGSVPTLEVIQRSIKRSHAVLKRCAQSRTIEAGWTNDARALDAKVVSVSSALTENSDMKLFGFHAYQFERWAWRVLGHETPEVIAEVRKKHYGYMGDAPVPTPAKKQTAQVQASALEQQLVLLTQLVTQLTTDLGELRNEVTELKNKPKRSRKAKSAETETA